MPRKPALIERPEAEQKARLMALLETAYDEQSDAQSKVERLEAQLRRLTGCDCTAMGITCKGHELREEVRTALKDTGTERNRA